MKSCNFIHNSFTRWVFNMLCLGLGLAHAAQHLKQLIPVEATKWPPAGNISTSKQMHNKRCSTYHAYFESRIAANAAQQPAVRRPSHCQILEMKLGMNAVPKTPPLTFEPQSTFGSGSRFWHANGQISMQRIKNIGTRAAEGLEGELSS